MIPQFCLGSLAQAGNPEKIFQVSREGVVFFSVAAGRDRALPGLHLQSRRFAWARRSGSFCRIHEVTYLIV